MSDYLVSILRTLIPTLWGSVIAWLISLAPVLDSVRDELEGLGLVLAAVCIAVYYAIVRVVEPHIPGWLARVLLGSSRSPGLYASEAQRRTAARADGDHAA